MSKITTRLTVAFAAALLASGAAMAQSKDFNSMVVDFGQAPGLSAKAAPAAAVAAKSRAEVVAELSAAQVASARADAELGISPAARTAPAATMLATSQK